MSKLRDIDIKYCLCNYFYDIITINDLDLDEILLDGKSHVDCLIYHTAYEEKVISYKSPYTYIKTIYVNKIHHCCS